MTTPSISDILDRLTDTQVLAFLAADESDTHCQFFSALYNDESLPGPQLIDAHPAWHDDDQDEGGTVWSFTPLGLEVQSALRASEGNRS